jgi:tryptophan-rich sensory protein
MKFLKKNVGTVVAAVAVSEMAGLVGAAFTAPAIPAWYPGLVKPVPAPPNWVFGPVWTLLYALMGISLALVWLKKGSVRLFFIQLGLNVFWSFLFFGLRNPGLAFAEIILLWLAIFATMYSFYTVSRVAAYLLLPHLVWVTFAAYLNWAIWALN